MIYRLGVVVGILGALWGICLGVLAAIMAFEGGKEPGMVLLVAGLAVIGYAAARGTRYILSGY